MNYNIVNELPNTESLVTFKNVVYQEPGNTSKVLADVEVLESAIDYMASPQGSKFSYVHLKSGTILKVQAPITTTAPETDEAQTDSSERADASETASAE